MKIHKRYPRELKERVVRMVFDHTPKYDSEWAAIRSIAGKFGMTAKTLRTWVGQDERDKGPRPRLTRTEHDRLAELEGENRELRRSNEILERGGFLRCGARPLTKIRFATSTSSRMT